MKSRKLTIEYTVLASSLSDWMDGEVLRRAAEKYGRLLEDRIEEAYPHAEITVKVLHDVWGVSPAPFVELEGSLGDSEEASDLAMEERAIEDHLEELADNLFETDDWHRGEVS